jgi:hypothetical protein
MVIDYKNVSFSFKNKKKKQLVKRIKIIAALLLIFFLYFAFKCLNQSGKIKNCQSLLLQNKTAQAADSLKKIAGSIFYRDSKKELTALLHLFNKEMSQAKQVLATLGKKDTVIGCRPFLDYFSDNGRYTELEIYTDYLLKKKKDVSFYHIVCKTALFDYKQSRRLIEKLPAAEKVKRKKELRLIQETNKKLESGRIDLLSDVNGLPLAYYDIKKKETVPLVPGIDFSLFSEDLNSSVKFYKLTIDKDVQEKIHRLFHDYYGSFLLLSLRDSSIMAAYSKPLNKKNKNAVFCEEYEPASIMKILTLFAYLKYYNKELFPFDCKGNLRLTDKIFYDWRTHGNVSNFTEAFAVSCNAAFASMGINVGLENLSGVLEKFYFNNAELSDLFLNFKTGRFNRDISTDFHLAKLSVGLSNNNEKKSSGNKTVIVTTTLHSALISAFIAYNGSIYPPYMINSINNVLNLGFYTHKGEIIHSFKEHNRIFLQIKEAMKAVVESPRGTGKRARVDFVKTAIKTGTAGDKNKGYDAILTGFFPAERPAYAFAFILRRVGKAEIKGAIFLKNFLVSFNKKLAEN